MSHECDKLLERLPEYVKGQLSETERQAFEAELRQSGCQEEFESLLQMWRKLEALPDETPGPALRPRFEAMLQAYKAGQRHARTQTNVLHIINLWLQRWWPRQPVVQFGLALAMLVAGLFLGGRMGSSPDMRTLRSEVSNLRQLVAISLLQSQSPSDRLRGVSYSQVIDRPDETTLAALLNTLNYDPNLNVRLATVDALAAFTDRELIRRGLLEALTRQTSPMLQISLIELLVAHDERRSLQVLREIERNEQVDGTVRKRARQAIEQLR